MHPRLLIFNLDLFINNLHLLEAHLTRYLPYNLRLGRREKEGDVLFLINGQALMKSRFQGSAVEREREREEGRPNINPRPAWERSTKKMKEQREEAEY